MLLKIYQCYPHREMLRKIGVDYSNSRVQERADKENEECPYCLIAFQQLKITKLESELSNALACPKLI